jgi:hypothetical protein
MSELTTFRKPFMITDLFPSSGEGRTEGVPIVVGPLEGLISSDVL